MATRAATAPSTGFGRIGFAGVLAGLVGLAITFAVGATMLLNPARTGVGTQLDPAVQRSLQVQLREQHVREYGLAPRPSSSDFAAWLQRHREIEYGKP